MKKCLECNAQVADNAYCCPKCGGKTLMGSYSAEDALSMLDSMKDQQAAREHVDRSAALFQEGRLEAAAAELRTALKIAPMNPVAHSNLGCILMKQGKSKEAIPWFEKALALDPNLEGVPAALAQAKSTATEKSGCFVATACFGDVSCSEVVTLRTYRDEHLARSSLGRVAIRAYYLLSPPLAAWLERHPTARSTVRTRLLLPLVKRIERTRYQ